MQTDTSADNDLELDRATVLALLEALPKCYVVDCTATATGEHFAPSYPDERYPQCAMHTTGDSPDTRNYTYAYADQVKALLVRTTAWGTVRSVDVATPEQLAVRWPAWVKVGVMMRGRGSTCAGGVPITLVEDHQLRLGADLYYLAYSCKFERLWEMIPTDGIASVEVVDSTQPTEQRFYNGPIATDWLYERRRHTSALTTILHQMRADAEQTVDPVPFNVEQANVAAADIFERTARAVRSDAQCYTTKHAAKLATKLLQQPAFDTDYRNALEVLYTISTDRDAAVAKILVGEHPSSSLPGRIEGQRLEFLRFESTSADPEMQAHWHGRAAGLDNVLSALGCRRTRAETASASICESCRDTGIVGVTSCKPCDCAAGAALVKAYREKRPI